jgi:hypothetical protein
LRDHGALWERGKNQRDEQQETSNQEGQARFFRQFFLQKDLMEQAGNRDPLPPGDSPVS